MMKLIKKADKKNFFIKDIVAIIVWAFVVRLLFSYLPSFKVDVNTWFAWAQRLGDLGFSKFYSDAVWTQYTPGYLYWLWFANKVAWTGDLMVKIPTIFFDIGTGCILYSILRSVNEKIARIALVLVIVNPVAIFNGSVWGQVDGILTFFLVVSSYFAIEKKNPYLSLFFWAIAFLIKPQAIAVLPFLGIYFLKNFSVTKIFISGLIGIGILVLLSLPFFPQTHIFGLLDLVRKMSDYYSYTSLFAFNFWGVIGMWKSDLITFLNISYFNWGIIIYLVSMAIVFLKSWKDLNDKKTAYLVLALSCLAFFIFPTRVHERYIFPALSFLLLAAFLNKSKALSFFYGLVVILNFINLYYAYAYYEKSYISVNSIQIFIEAITKPLSLILLVVFFGIIFWKKFEKYFVKLHLPSIKNKSFFENPKTYSFDTLKISKRKIKILFLGIIVFAAITRFYNLQSPETHYFDEVYHAFTAQQMLHGNTKAWEWWNPNPEGFAYEWTHPPIAKEGMVLGMLFLGDNALGYRAPGAILGVGSVILVYFLAKEIFDDEIVALLASSVMALDGLPLVLSRIGMNDSYVLFFSLAAVLFYLKKKNLPASIFFGLAMASKWSALWVVPIIVFIHFVWKRSFKKSYIFFFIVPPLIYISTYFPIFTNQQIQKEYIANTNYLTKTDGVGIPSLDMFIDVQKQMWWYHTNLRATHPYTSLWFTWPFMVRPIYLYTSNEVNDQVARIYAMGNPVVFWGGITSIVFLSYLTIRERDKRLGLVVFSYLIFFTPWALSPRIMFLYHYLPSVPFMTIAIAYILRRYKDFMWGFLTLAFITFIYFYPHFAGLTIPLQLDSSYYWFKSWR